MEEREILTVRDLCKTFTLSKRQQKIEKTHEKKKKAVDHLSFTAYEGEIFGLLGPNGCRPRRRRCSMPGDTDPSRQAEMRGGGRQHQSHSRSWYAARRF